MKILIIVARILLGLMFLAAGLIKVFPMVHMTMPGGDAGTMMGLMFAHGWLRFYGSVEAVGGLMVLSGRFVPLGLTLLAGMGVNILLFNITLAPSSLPLPLFLALLELFLVYAYRTSFAGIFTAKAESPVR
jgi:putative oxidoreductase